MEAATVAGGATGLCPAWLRVAGRGRGGGSVAAALTAALAGTGQCPEAWERSACPSPACPFPLRRPPAVPLPPHNLIRTLFLPQRP